MRQKIYLKSRCNFAVLHWNEKEVVWQVTEFCKFGLDAVCVAMCSSLKGDGSVVLAERGAGSVLIRGKEIVDFNWMEWEVKWSR